MTVGSHVGVNGNDSSACENLPVSSLKGQRKVLFHEPCSFVFSFLTALESWVGLGLALTTQTLWQVPPLSDWNIKQKPKGNK